jgi:hypothetical protein
MGVPLVASETQPQNDEFFDPAIEGQRVSGAPGQKYVVLRLIRVGN